MRRLLAFLTVFLGASILGLIVVIALKIAGWPVATWDLALCTFCLAGVLSLFTYQVATDLRSDLRAAEAGDTHA
jgi:hypothetical protein